MLRHFSNYVVGRGQRVQGADQVLQVAVAPDPPKARFRLHQCARHPALNHLAATPPLDVACVALDAAVEVLNDVRRAQRTLQRPRQAESLHGQRLLESLPDGRCGTGMVAFQRPGQPLEHPRRAVRRIKIPRIPQRLADRRVQPLGQMAEHVPALVYLATLHHAARSEHVGDGPA